MPELLCPLCQTQLVLVDRSYRCDNNHSFDVAKEGYVNLLPVQHKKTKQPGDSKAMLQSRKRFLDAGYYLPLVEGLTALFEQYATAEADCIDVGCGEGYYSYHLQQQFGHRWAAVDIAKPGMQMTAKRKYCQHAAVASAYQLPFAEGGFDTALSVFSPYSAAELARVLKPQGVFIAVGPGAAHLSGLAQHVYDEVQAHQGNQRDVVDVAEGFTLLERRTVNTEIMVEQAHIADLLAMTPYFWQCSAAKQQAIAALPALTTPIAFELAVYQRQ